MSSQKSSAVRTAGDAAARAPKRARGRLRVNAIIDAGACLFAERGYDATTMTAIAARSATAIGSLYRFFPTKEALADALLERYVGEVGAALDAIEVRAPALSSADIADALFELMTNERANRAALVALLDVRPDAVARRTALRGRVRQGIAAILRAAAPGLAAADAAPVAAVVLHMLKGARALATEVSRDAAKELRRAIGIYVTQVLDEARQSEPS